MAVSDKSKDLHHLSLIQLLTGAIGREWKCGPYRSRVITGREKTGNEGRRRRGLIRKGSACVAGKPFVYIKMCISLTHTQAHSLLYRYRRATLQMHLHIHI